MENLNQTKKIVAPLTWTVFKNAELMPLDVPLLVEIDDFYAIDRFQVAIFTKPNENNSVLGFIGGLNYKFKSLIIRYKYLDIS
jgi:hypothetical protein